MNRSALVTPARPSALPVVRRDRLDALAGCMLLAVGLLFPATSNGRLAAWPLLMAQMVVTVILLGAWYGGTRRFRTSRQVTLLLTASAALLLWGYTLVSPEPYVTWGALVPYVALFAFTNVRLRPAYWELLDRALVVAVGGVLIAGLLVIVDFGPTRELLVRYFTVGYADLVPNMMNRGRPVFTLGSHSLASFTYALLGVLLLLAYYRRGGWWRLALVGGLCILLAQLGSVAGLLLLPAMVLAVGAVVVIRGRQLAWLIVFVTATLAVGGVWVAWDVVQREPLITETQTILESRTNGFLGRYGRTGTVTPTLEYVGDKPFLGTGLTTLPGLHYTDSGPFVHALRGSVLLPLTIYVSLWLAIRDAIGGKAERVVVLGTLALVEVAYIASLHPRGLAIAVFAVLYAASLRPVGELFDDADSNDVARCGVVAGG